MSWNYSDDEFIKVYRKMISWEWYTDVNTKVLFLHCLLKANWKDGSWKGYDYKRGQFITSLSSLAKETGLTVKQVRTALKHLERTGEVASWSDSKVRIITVLSYDSFQVAGKPKGKQGASDGQAKGKQGATDIRTFKNIRSKEEYTPLRGLAEFEPVTQEEIEAGGWE